MTKKLFCFILLSILFLSCRAGSTSDEYYEPGRFWECDSEGLAVDGVDHLKDFEHYNFSGIWMKNQDMMLGYIGDNFQRFYIHFNKIQKSHLFPRKYLISGKTKVRNAVSNFAGKIILLHIYGMNQSVKQRKLDEYRKAMKEHDLDLDGRYKENRFVAVIRYNFLEDSKQSGSGEISGIAKTYFYLEAGKIFYDDLNLEWSDGYSNNLFVGIWKGYNTGAVKKCNFGNFRIPYSGDLDTGAGEFAPNKKYLDNGWRVYFNSSDDKEALAEEKRAWWK